MAPPRKVVREQLETMVDWLEENNDMCRGVAPGSPITLQASRQKWIILAKKLNAVPGGSLKTPEGWKKYWFEWRHKCRKKAADGRRYQSGSDSGKNRFIPLNDLEIRVLNLCGLGSVAPTLSASQQLEDFLAEESESEQTLDTIKAQSAPVIIKKRQIKKIKKDGSGLHSISKRESTDGLAGDTSVNIDDSSYDDMCRSTPPPKWALVLEERRIAAEERMAEALASMAAVMRSQEERRANLDERIADALTTIAGSVQDLNAGVQQALQHLHANGTDLDNKHYPISKIYCE